MKKSDHNMKEIQMEERKEDVKEQRKEFSLSKPYIFPIDPYYNSVTSPSSHTPTSINIVPLLFESIILQQFLLGDCQTKKNNIQTQTKMKIHAKNFGLRKNKKHVQFVIVVLRHKQWQDLKKNKTYSIP